MHIILLVIILSFLGNIQVWAKDSKEIPDFTLINEVSRSDFTSKDIECAYMLVDIHAPVTLQKHIESIKDTSSRMICEQIYEERFAPLRYFKRIEQKNTHLSEAISPYLWNARLDLFKYIEEGQKKEYFDTIETSKTLSKEMKVIDKIIAQRTIERLSLKVEGVDSVWRLPNAGKSISKKISDREMFTYQESIHKPTPKNKDYCLYSIYYHKDNNKTKICQFTPVYYGDKISQFVGKLPLPIDACKKRPLFLLQKCYLFISSTDDRIGYIIQNTLSKDQATPLMGEGSHLDLGGGFSWYDVFIQEKTDAITFKHKRLIEQGSLNHIIWDANEDPVLDFKRK